MSDQIVGYLVNRLHVEQWYALHPEIDEQEIVAPLIGLGLPRTGSTALSFLLAQDPARRSLRNWEAVKPCPPPETATEHTDPRDRSAGVPAGHGARLPVASLRGHVARPALQLMAPAMRHGAGVPLPPSRPEAVAVALPARA